MLGGVFERSKHRRRFAALGYRDERIAFADVERGGLAASAFGVVLEELHGADEREVAAGHYGRSAVGELEFLRRKFRRAAVEEVAPHRFKENGEAACRAAA